MREVRPGALGKAKLLSAEPVSAKHLALGCSDGVVRLWDWTKGAVASTCTGAHDKSVVDIISLPPDRDDTSTGAVLHMLWVGAVTQGPPIADAVLRVLCACLAQPFASCLPVQTLRSRCGASLARTVPCRTTQNLPPRCLPACVHPVLLLIAWTCSWLTRTELCCAVRCHLPGWIVRVHDP